METPPELPFDLITEILSWFPLESLLRFRCVCRQWHALIQEPYFVPIHMRRARRTYWFGAHDRDVHDGRLRMLDCSAGLLLEMNVTTLRYYIRNQAIHQVLALPAPRSINNAMFIAVESATGECKVLSVLARQGSRENAWEILSVRRDDHEPAIWRALQPRSAEQDHWFTVKTDWGIHSKEVVTNDDQQDSEFKIVSFDLFRENFEHNTLPHGSLSGDFSRAFMFPWDKSVCVGELIGRELHIMELKRHADKYRWSSGKIIVPLRFLEESRYRKEYLVPTEATSDDLWFRYDVNLDSLCCDPKTGRIKVIVGFLEDWFLYQPSTLALRGMASYEDNQG